LQGVKSFRVRFPIINIFKLFRFVILESMTYVRLGAKVSFMSMITFVVIVHAPCDLCLVITYVSTIENDVL
jgi:hypothetical protein